MPNKPRFVPFWQRQAQPLAQMGILPWIGVGARFPAQAYSPAQGAGTPANVHTPQNFFGGNWRQPPARTATPATGVHTPQDFYQLLYGKNKPGKTGWTQAHVQWRRAQSLGRAPGYAPAPDTAPEGGGAGPGPAGGGGGGGGGYAPAPAGVDPRWYRQFQREHGGQTPEEYYAQTGEDIGHALADEEWGRQFEREHGRAPSEYDWRHHWFMTRTGHPPPEGMEQWMREQAEGYGTEEADQRPPTYQPPMVIWR